MKQDARRVHALIWSAMVMVPLAAAGSAHGQSEPVETSSGALNEPDGSSGAEADEHIEGAVVPSDVALAGHRVTHVDIALDGEGEGDAAYDQALEDRLMRGDSWFRGCVRDRVPADPSLALERTARLQFTVISRGLVTGLSARTLANVSTRCLHQFVSAQVEAPPDGRRTVSLDVSFYVDYQEILERQIAAHRGTVRARYLRYDPSYSGHLGVEITIGAEGFPSAVHVMDDHVEDAVQDEILAEIHATRFSPPPSGSATVRVGYDIGLPYSEVIRAELEHAEERFWTALAADDWGEDHGLRATEFVVEFTIDEDGTPEHVRVVSDDSEEDLGTIARRHLRELRFSAPPGGPQRVQVVYDVWSGQAPDAYVHHYGVDIDGLIRLEGRVCLWYTSQRRWIEGRPLVAEGKAVFASAGASREWGTKTGVAMPVTPTSEAAARWWTRSALAEHASIASFARATLELMALAAPPDLLVRTQQAGNDEVQHAERCFAIASRAKGEAVGPGVLSAVHPRPLDYGGLARAVFSEACVGETVATLVAVRQRRGARLPAVQAALDEIIEDEARHAALGWDTLSWALGHAPDVAADLRALAERARRRYASPSSGDGATIDEKLRCWGLLSEHEVQAAAHEAVVAIVMPMLSTILSRR